MQYCCILLLYYYCFLKSPKTARKATFGRLLADFRTKLYRAIDCGTEAFYCTGNICVSAQGVHSPAVLCIVRSGVEFGLVHDQKVSFIHTGVAVRFEGVIPPSLLL